MLNLYLFALREHASEQTLDQIDAALEPPLTWKSAEGVPIVYGSDEDAWAEFAAQMGA